MAVGLTLAIMVFAVPIPTIARQPKALDSFQRQVLPLLERYCVDCHMNEKHEAGIVLDRFDDQTALSRTARPGSGCAMRSRDASCRRRKSPSRRSQSWTGSSAWIEKDFLAAQCDKQASSAPVVIRRLNRQEYNNTIRDLLGLDLHLADAFPADDIGFGFDNVGSALNISPVHVEKYLDAAELALHKAIVLPDAEEYSPIELIGLKTYPLPPDKPVEFKHALKPGRYLADFSLVRVGIAESVPPPRLVIGFGKDRRTVDAVRVQDETVVYRYWLTVAEGDNLVHVALAPGQADSANVVRPKAWSPTTSAVTSAMGPIGIARRLDGRARPGRRSRPSRFPNRIEGSCFATPEYGDQSRLDCARQVIARFAERAFRRPRAARRSGTGPRDLSAGRRPR